MTTTPQTDRVRVRRQPRRGRYDRTALDEVLDAGLVAHVAFADRGQPFCVPMLYARVGDDVYVHGSSASRVIRVLGDGVPACLTVTHLDGLVLARSAFEHSANYRSAMLLGSFRSVEGEEARLAALEALTNRLLPGRWSEVRPPDRRELKATRVLALRIREASVKVRTGPPSDCDSPDAARDTWAGVLPVVTTYGEPEPAPGLRSEITLERSTQWVQARTTSTS